MRPVGCGPQTIEAVEAVAKVHGMNALKPIYLALNEKVSYDDIRVVVACARQAEGPSKQLKTTF